MADDSFNPFGADADHNCVAFFVAEYMLTMIIDLWKTETIMELDGSQAWKAKRVSAPEKWIRQVILLNRCRLKWRERSKCCIMSLAPNRLIRNGLALLSGSPHGTPRIGDCVAHHTVMPTDGLFFGPI
jgi:hypothetical protein